MNNTSVIHINTDYHIPLGASDYIIVVHVSALKIYLPPLADMPTAGFFNIKNFNVTNTQIIPQAGELIDGLSLLYLYGILDNIWIWYVGTYWVMGSLGRPREIVKIISGNYIMTPADSIVIQTLLGATTTLPSAVGLQGITCHVKNSGISTKSSLVAAPQGQTIDGSAGSYTLSGIWNSARFMSDNANWLTL